MTNDDDMLNQFPELEKDLRDLFNEMKSADASRLSQEEESPRILGDFRILKKIGSGGMGSVYEAEQISLKRKVALKILPAHLSFSDEAVNKFYREAEAGGRQNHPGIVGVHSMGEQSGVYFIAQELVKNCVTLNDFLNEQQRNLAPGYFRKIAQLFLEIGEALDHAHQAGVIHRDVKPSNILITKEGKPKVTDFGLAKVEDAMALSRSGELAGTPYYMSPEQASSRIKKIDKRTDIYSLGVTLYEALTFQRPFQGNTSHEVLKKIILHEPKDPGKVNPKAPHDLSMICLKAMEKSADNRYGSMTELAEDLKRYLSGDVILAKPSGFYKRFWKLVKRNAAVSLTLGAACLILISFLFYILWSYPQILKEKQRAMMETSAKMVALQELHEELDRSEGYRLATLSANLASKSPGAALRLAMESAKRYPSIHANNAIVDSIENCHEQMTLYPSHIFIPGPLLFFGEDGLCLSYGNARKTFWNLKTNRKEPFPYKLKQGYVSSRFSKDQKFVIFACTDKTARIINTETKEEVMELRGHNKPLKLALLSPNNKLALTFAKDGPTRVWNVETGKEMFQAVEGEAGVFSPDSAIVLIRSKNRKKLNIYDMNTGKRLFALRNWLSFFAPVVFPPDNKSMLVARGDKEVQVVDRFKGDVIFEYSKHPAKATAFSLCQDGKTVVSGSKDGTVLVWDLKSRETIFTLKGHDGSVSGIDVSRDGQKALTYSENDRCARVWDLNSGECLAVLRGHEMDMTSAVFSPSGERIATASEDKTIRIWSIKSCYQFLQLGSKKPNVAHAEFTPDNKLLVIRDKNVQICDRETGKILKQIKGVKANYATMSRDGQKLLILKDDSRSAVVLDMTTNETILNTRDRRFFTDFYRGQFSPDGSQVLITSPNSHIWVIDLKSKTMVSGFKGHASGPLLISFAYKLQTAYSHDSSRIVSGGNDDCVKVWDSRTGKELLNLDLPDCMAILGVHFSPDDKRINVSPLVATNRTYDSKTGELLYKCPPCANAADPFSSDGHWFLTASETNHNIQVRRVETGDTRHSLWGHSSLVRLISFDQEGHRIVSVSQNYTVRVWDANRAEEWITFKGHKGQIDQAIFSPDGKSVLTLDINGIARVWPVDIYKIALQNAPRKLTLMEKLKFKVWAPGEERSVDLIKRIFMESDYSDEFISSIEQDTNLSEETKIQALNLVK